MVVDANVWVARAVETEPDSLTSRRWLGRQLRSGTAFFIPNLAVAEVAGALARRWGDSPRALSAVRAVVQFPRLQVLPLDETLGNRAVELAARLQLRGSDAVYVALAESLRVPLITWGTELLDRAPAVVATLQPS